MESAKQKAEWIRERSGYEQESAQLRLSTKRNFSEVSSLSDQLRASQKLLEERSSQCNMAKAAAREAEAECLRLKKQLTAAQEKVDASKAEMRDAVRKVEDRLAKQRASLQDSASHTAMQLAQVSLQQATAEAALRELRKEVSVERAAAALKRKVQKEEASENERKLATEVGSLRMQLEDSQQDYDASVQQRNQLQTELRDAHVNITSLTQQVQEHQAREREGARQAASAMRADAVIHASLKATSEALQRLHPYQYAQSLSLT